MDLGPLLRAHGFLRVERPPMLWHAAVDDVPLIRLLGELLSATLVRGNALGEIVLNASNVSVAADPADAAAHPADSPQLPAPGDYVALTVSGRGECGPLVRWSPGSTGSGVLVNDDVDRAARAAAIPFAYTAARDGVGSVTIFLRRAS